MKLKQWGVTGIVLLAMSVWVTGPVVAGNLDSPGNPGSTMYTLEQIYERLDALETRIDDGGGAAADDGVGTGAFEPATGPAPTMHTLTDIYGKIDAIDGAIGGLIGDPNGGDGTWPAPVQQTGVDHLDYCGPTSNRDDCLLQKGVEWPEPRFTVNGNGTVTDNNGTVTDNLTGLVWLHRAMCDAFHTGGAIPDGIPWEVAMERVGLLSAEDGGHTCGLDDGSRLGDWRMPNVREFMSLYNFGPYKFDPYDIHDYELRLPREHPFRPNPYTGVRLPSVDLYWTSTPRVTPSGVQGMFVFSFYMGRFPISEFRDHTDPDYKFFLWPVRDLRPDELPGGGDDD